MEWTGEQKQIIRLRDRNLLVAAAAGSGKTAVLVERIMAMITDRKKPVDIDRLLVVTFTNAAAGEMRERIGKRLEKLLLESPKDQNLRRQEDLLPHAKIMTIDSFCLQVARNYFSFLDLDPDFRIGDEGELKLLREEVMEELLEEEYRKASPDFLLFVESYGGGKSDENIAEYIDRLYQFAAAYPEPEEQLTLWKEQLSVSGERVGETSWMEALMEGIHLAAEEMNERYEAAIGLCMEAEGLSAYGTMFQSDQKIVTRLLQAGSYEEAEEVLAVMKKAFVTKPRISKKTPVDEEAKEFLSSLRDALKKELLALAEAYDLGEPAQAYGDIQNVSGPLSKLVDLAIAYGRAFDKAKREKNMVDFNDVAHFALRILTRKAEDGKRIPSETAMELGKSFHEIMIDEYQDSNWIQEDILRSVSKEWEGKPNIFMVGDVKQSIYSFRQARPEMFAEKYTSYTKEDGLHQKIDLHRNFRSRETVLAAANFLFSQLMDQRLGGITYDEAAALIPGRVFPEDQDSSKTGAPERKPDGMDADFWGTEVLLADVGQETLQEADEALQEYQAKELEARMVAGRIRELTAPEGGLRILDRETGKYRTARYGDIVILLRTITGWAEVFTDVLTEAGIPSYAQTRTGYFSSREIRCVLNLLRIIDNPMQDIPLAAVLHSPIGGFTSEEMAVLMAEAGKELIPGSVRGLYGALKAFVRKEREPGEGKTLEEKTRSFLGLLSDLRERAVYMRLHELLRYILEKTGYGCMLAAMPGGNVRKKNMEMLLKRAVDYENTSYQGVFQFVRYIEKLQKYSVDFGEAAPFGGEAEAVRITSIHKSKGLEYPIVILSGAGKGFNRQESNRHILFHPKLGLAADFVDVEARVRTATLPKKVLQRKLRQDLLGEELRVLYVALTRAEEKLIITGTDRYLETKLVKWNSLRLAKGERLPHYAVSSAGSYLDWILMALIRNRAYGGILAERGITPPVFHELYGREVPVSIRLITLEELVREEVSKQVVDRVFREGLLGPRAEGEKELKARIRSSLSYRYPYEESVTAPRKFSVSELKEEGFLEEPTEERLFAKQVYETPMRPRFLESEEPLFGAAKGTAYHRLLELLPFSLRPLSDETVLRAVKELETQGLLPENTQERLNLKKIRRFLASPLGRRMAVAKRLKKEQQFVMGLPAGTVRPEYENSSFSEEIMLIQGIIDAWFEEEGGLVIVDYKTDRLDGLDLEDAKKYLTDRYRIQLDYYQKALEMNTGKPVVERYLYSFFLEEAVLL